MVAQPGSALAWGARGRWFESSPPDKAHLMWAFLFIVFGINYDHHIVSKRSLHSQFLRDVAQPGSAPRSGRGGRWFESSHPDQFSIAELQRDCNGRQKRALDVERPFHL